MDRDPELEDSSDDSGDEDYVLGCEDDLPSEEECDGEPEEDLPSSGDAPKSGRKRKPRRTDGGSKRTRVGRGRVEEEDTDETKTTLTEEDEKKKTDSLWSDFLQDAVVSSPPKQQVVGETASSSGTKKVRRTESPSEATDKRTVTVTQVFDFAGEEVQVTKEVPAHSRHAAKNGAGLGQTVNKASQQFGGKAGPKPSNGGGISAILGQIGKKSKIGTLEKSKLDWERFKSAQNLHADIEVHNRGRNGFLEKQDFLQRADVRQFEIEKQMRTTTRRAR